MGATACVEPHSGDRHSKNGILFTFFSTVFPPRHVGHTTYSTMCEQAIHVSSVLSYTPLSIDSNGRRREARKLPMYFRSTVSKCLGAKRPRSTIHPAPLRLDVVPSSMDIKSSKCCGFRLRLMIYLNHHQSVLSKRGSVGCVARKELQLESLHLGGLLEVHPSHSDSHSHTLWCWNLDP